MSLTKALTINLLAFSSLIILLLSLLYTTFSIPVSPAPDRRQLTNEITHYLCLIPLLVPVTAWFVIARWVGREYDLNG